MCMRRCKLNRAVDVFHLNFELMMQDGEICDQTGFGSRDGCFDIGLVFWERRADA